MYNFQQINKNVFIFLFRYLRIENKKWHGKIKLMHKFEFYMKKTFSFNKMVSGNASLKSDV